MFLQALIEMVNQNVINWLTIGRCEVYIRHSQLS